jgi:hypothetical protein
MKNRAIPPTNNGSEQAIRPCVTFRKVTNCFRLEWGAKLYADIRSTLETARRRAIGSRPADWVGACAASLMPLVLAIRAHVFVAERIHADDTTVPVQAKGKCRIGRLWTYVRAISPSAAAISRRRLSSTRPIAAANILTSIWQPMPG